jgi:DNA-binding IclR family transcriptional regulator
LAILAFMPETQWSDLLAPPLTAVTEHTITDLDHLCQELAQIRKHGYAVADETLEVGLIAIGAPLLNHDSDVPAAISVAGPRLRLTPTRVAEIGALVMEAAGRVSMRLGYRPVRKKELTIDFST